jgi:hypothetical protein
VEPETISESSSPIPFKFWHNDEFKYACAFTYIGTSISGYEAVEPETISDSSSLIELQLWHNLAFQYVRTFIYAMGRDGTEPQQCVAGYS